MGKIFIKNILKLGWWIVGFSWKIGGILGILSILITHNFGISLIYGIVITIKVAFFGFIAIGLARIFLEKEEFNKIREQMKINRKL